MDKGYHYYFPNAARSLSSISCHASRAASSGPKWVKACMQPGNIRYVTSTPASLRRAAYRSPSPRSGSCSAVITSAAGSPERSAASSGESNGLRVSSGAFT